MDLYLLFTCPYRSLNLLSARRQQWARRGLWDRDVVEMFFGDDWDNIRHYLAGEINSTADWIDLAIDLDPQRCGARLEVGWTTTARIDEKARDGTPRAGFP